MWLIPENLVDSFENKIINIHPALLPNYGGKGMYGMHVHNAVINAKEKESGITIHYVNKHYDEGKVIAQFKCEIKTTDTAEDLANKIHVLEQKHFTHTINSIL
jgi:phosphoribosylglycinamide formyltransferase-1